MVTRSDGPVALAGDAIGLLMLADDFNESASGAVSLAASVYATPIDEVAASIGRMVGNSTLRQVEDLNDAERDAVTAVVRVLGIAAVQAMTTEMGRLLGGAVHVGALVLRELAETTGRDGGELLTSIIGVEGESHG